MCDSLHTYISRLLSSIAVVILKRTYIGRESPHLPKYLVPYQLTFYVFVGTKRLGRNSWSLWAPPCHPPFTATHKKPVSRFAFVETTCLTTSSVTAWPHPRDHQQDRMEPFPDIGCLPLKYLHAYLPTYVGGYLHVGKKRGVRGTYVCRCKSPTDIATVLGMRLC